MRTSQAQACSRIASRPCLAGPNGRILLKGTSGQAGLFCEPDVEHPCFWLQHGVSLAKHVGGSQQQASGNMLFYRTGTDMQRSGNFFLAESIHFLQNENPAAMQRKRCNRTTKAQEFVIRMALFL